MNTATPRIPDVRLLTDDYCQGFYTDFDTPEARFKLLKEVCEQRAKQGEAALFYGHHRAGEFDQLDLSKLSYFGGYGRDVSQLTMTAQHDAADDPKTEVKPDKPARVAILISGSTTVEHCTLENIPANQSEDGALIGFPQAGAHSALIKDVTLRGQDWTFYHWAAKDAGAVLVMEDCDVYFNRQGVTQAGNNANKSRWELKRVRFYGNANGSESLGDSSGTEPRCVGGLLGVVFRCGELEMRDCEFVTMRGLDKDYSTKFGAPRIACITDTYSSNANKGTIIRHRGTRFCDIAPGTAIEAKHIDMNYGKIEEWRQGEWVNGVVEGGQGR